MGTQRWSSVQGLFVCGFGLVFFRINNVREMLPYHLDFNFEIKLLLRHPCYLSFLMVPYQNDRSLIFINS